MSALLTPDALADTARARCETLGAPGDREERRRLRGTLGDGVRVVLFARATRDRWALRRVELVRRARDGRQRGFVWDGEGDAVRAVEWPAGAGRPAEVTTLPRGGPLPRALRALARRLLALPCAPRAADARG